MYKVLLKTVILLGSFFYLGLGLLQAEETNEKKPDTTIGKFGNFQVSVGQGFFVRDLRDKDGNGNGNGNNFVPSAGALVHVFHPNVSFLGLSAGFGLNGSDVINNLQVGLGASLLLHTTEEEVFALTFGRLLGQVEHMEDDASTNMVYKDSWFGAVTYTIKFSKLINIAQGRNSAEVAANAESETGTTPATDSEGETNAEVETDTEEQPAND